MCVSVYCELWYRHETSPGISSTTDSSLWLTGCMFMASCHGGTQKDKRVLSFDRGLSFARYFCLGLKDARVFSTGCWGLLFRALVFVVEL